MLDGLVARYREVRSRVRRVERRELRELRAWLEDTRNLIHLSLLVMLPLTFALVTALSNMVDLLPFLLFPPLASGSYTLFAHPESRYASPRRFIGGLTAGALCGWLALEVGALFLYDVAPTAYEVHPGSAALGLFLTGVVTWAVDMEEASAFSTALLVHVTGTAEFAYVVSVALSTTIVAAIFLLWRESFYEERARYLYETTRGDDHVLVPMRSDDAGTVAMFGARIAAAHDAGKVVLLDIVDDEAVAAAEQEALERLVGVDTAAVGTSPESDSEEGAHSSVAAAVGERPTHASVETAVGSETDETAVAEQTRDAAEREVAAESVRRLERQANRIETEVGVPCDVVVATDGGDSAGVVQQTADETNCDLVAVADEEHNGGVSPFIRSLLAGERDVVVLRTSGDREESRWRRVMVTARRGGDVAHAMIDFALRVAGRSGEVSVCTCIDSEDQRRRAEDVLAQLVETFSGRFETRVANADIREFIEENADHYDLVVMGASTDRSRASRFVAPPTFRRVRDVDCDVAIVHRGW